MSVQRRLSQIVLYTQTGYLKANHLFLHLRFDARQAQQVVDKLRQSPAQSGGNEIGAE